jgi:hypothetical protein
MRETRDLCYQSTRQPLLEVGLFASAGSYLQQDPLYESQDISQAIKGKSEVLGPQNTLKCLFLLRSNTHLL